MCAIVHPTNPRLSINGGVSSAIAAATRLHRFEGTCSRLLSSSSGHITRGTAMISSFPSTPGTQLHLQHVIHAVLPPCSGKLSSLLGCRCTFKACADVTLSMPSTSLRQHLLHLSNRHQPCPCLHTSENGFMVLPQPCVHQTVIIGTLDFDMVLNVALLRNSHTCGV